MSTLFVTPVMRILIFLATNLIKISMICVETKKSDSDTLQIRVPQQCTQQQQILRSTEILGLHFYIKTCPKISHQIGCAKISVPIKLWRKIYTYQRNLSLSSESGRDEILVLTNILNNCCFYEIFIFVSRLMDMQVLYSDCTHVQSKSNKLHQTFTDISRALMDALSGTKGPAAEQDNR